jgi:hypothetical protein
MGDVEWIEFAQERVVGWRALVNAVLNLRFS